MAGLACCVLLIAGCGTRDPSDGDTGPVVEDPGPVHVHGLGIDPKDGSLFVASHTGLFRAAADADRLRRVADRYQDTMGFTVVGPNHFLGSGHPDLRERLPPYLGLIESRDAGRTWRPVSLQGQRDLHVLESRGRRIYGYGADFGSRREALLVSVDAGRTWRQRATPGSLASLAISPADANHVVASGVRGTFGSQDAGRTWRRLSPRADLVAWPAGDVFLGVNPIIALDGDGKVRRSEDGGRDWVTIGDVGGEPTAFEAVSARELYVALHDGAIRRSADGGATWATRSGPG